MQSTTGKLPAGKGHYSQSTCGQTPKGLSTTGNAMAGKILRGQRDWQATYDRPINASPCRKSVPIERIIQLTLTVKTGLI